MHKKDLRERIANLSPEQKRLLERKLKGKREEHSRDNFYKLTPVEERDYYPVSSAQKRVYFLDRLEDTGTVYNMPVVLNVQGKLDKNRLERAFRELTRRHESLRTSFHTIDEQPVQRIHDQVAFSLEDLSFLYDLYDPYDLYDLYKSFINPFELSRPPLMRAGLVPIGAEEHLLLFDMHHIISDGTSVGLLVDEFTRLYDGQDLEPLIVRYKDFADWQNRLFDSGRIARQEKYWLEVYSDAPDGGIPRLNLPTDFPRPDVFSFEGDRYVFELSHAPGFLRMLKDNDVTLFMNLLTALNVLMHRYSGQEDIVIGSGIAGRPHAGLQRVVGMFVNMLALRNRPAGNKSYREFLLEVKTNSLEALENQDVQFEALVDRLNLERDLSHNPLFDVALVLHNFQLREISINDLVFRPQEIEHTTAKFDITFSAGVVGDKIVMGMLYCTRLFTRGTIERMAAHLDNIIRQVIDNPEIKISDIDLMDESERRQILDGFNETQFEYPAGKTVHRLFREQVARTPGNIAVVSGGESITYDRLDETSNRIANYLCHEKQLRPGDRVGLLLEPSHRRVEAILGVLKAGGAYVPMEPSLPVERIKTMVDEAGIGIIVSDESFPALEAHGADDPGIVVRANDPAYIIFTSGTTGVPRGVMVEHRALVNLSCWHNRYYEITVGDSAVLYAGFGFDASVWELFPYMLAGAAVHVIPDDIKLDMEALNRYFEENGITVAFLPTQVCEQFMRQDNRSLRLLLTGGDKLRQFKQNNYRLYNNYGPTENAVVTTACPVTGFSGNIPIGKPIDNNRVYILRKDTLDPQPVGVPGELCIAGDSLARGYINNPELTAQKFINSKFKIQNSKLYKSGDLCRWLPDGNIEFLGRVDSQVKIRGFRIEPGEIEARLMEFPGVDEAAVTVSDRGDGDKYLCACVVGAGLKPVRTGLRDDLRAFLSERLPDYMVPAHFDFLDELPLTSSGKVDRRALPVPDLGTGKNYDENYVAPVDDIESRLVEIWSGILGIPAGSIGTTADFFQVGGHSLKATNLVSRIHRAFDVKIPLAKLFKTPTIQALRSYIKNARTQLYTAVEPSEKKEYYALSSPQKRLYVLQQVDNNSTAYNVPAMINLGDTPDEERLEGVLRQLIDRHETLRTSFHMVGEAPVQRIHDNIDFSLERFQLYDLSDPYDPYVLSNKLSRPFDLSRAPLFRAVLVTGSDGSRHLFIDMHHIITDGTSHGILERDFTALYAGRTLPPLRLQYRDYAEWSRGPGQEAVICEQEQYWLRQLEGELPVLDLPADFPRPLEQGFKGNRVDFILDEELTRAIERMAATHGVTSYMCLLAIWNILFSRLCGIGEIIIGTPVAARRHSDLQQVIGVFINTLAMRNYPSGEKRFADFLVEIKERTLSAFENQEYPFEELVDKLAVKRDLGRNPVFDVMLNLLNQSEYRENRLNIETGRHRESTSKFDLSVTAVDLGGRFLLNLEYSVELFKPGTIERFLGYFKNILSYLSNASNHASRLCDIPVLSDVEKSQVLEFSNGEAGEYKDIPIHRFFENRVAQVPGNNAVICGERALTYRRLDEQAEGVALYLREKGIEPGGIVAVMMKRSVEIAVALSGILKAGCAYIPIDPEYPQERIDYILSDSNASLLLTDDDIIQSHPVPCGAAIQPATRNPQPVTSLCYIIYTSGSTGLPKGVMIDHRNVANFIEGMNRVFDFHSEDTLLSLTTISFDIFVTELFYTLSRGAAVVLGTEEEQLNAEAAFRVMRERNVGILQLTPSRLQLLMYHPDASIYLKPLRYLLLAGEVLPAHLRDRAAGIVEGKIYNLYGPTEATIYSTYKDVTGDTPITIGRPVFNFGIHILDKHRCLQPIGVPGEMYISGAGVARGYLNNPEQTHEKFIFLQNKSFWESRTLFTKRVLAAGGNLYKSGDLCRWLPDGDIEFLGRIDRQVKIRGFRVESGEIEHILVNHASVKEAVVSTHTDNNDNTELCAYLVYEDGCEPDHTGVRDYLSSKLPEYMIPSCFMQLESMPLTPNRKIDRSSLPAPVVAVNHERELPVNETESKLTGIWADVLGVDAAAIGTGDNFFQVGGHSLKGTIMTARILKTFRVEMPLGVLFKTPTIRQLAQYIDNNVRLDTHSAPDAVEKREYYPLSSVQKRLYTVFRLDPGSTGYNIPSVTLLEGRLDTRKSENVFRRLIQRHESLRTSFPLIEGEPVQRVHREIDFAIQYADSRGDSPAETLRDFTRAFDLAEPPLFRVGLIRIGETSHILVLDFHHIIFDGVSNGVFRKEFMALYSGKTLAAPRLQYRDYTGWMSRPEQVEAIETQGKYWFRQFRNSPPLLELPADFPRPQSHNSGGNYLAFSLDSETTTALNRLAKEEEVTLYILLLTIFYVFLHRLGGQEDIVVGTSVAGRRHADLQNIIGMFVNALALRNYPSGDKIFREFLAEVKNNVLEAFDYHDYPFEDLVTKLAPKRIPGRNPIFDVMFILNNEENPDVVIDGLTMKPYGDYEKTSAQMDMKFRGRERDGMLVMGFEYSTSLFKEETIQRFVEFYKDLVAIIIDNRDTLLEEIRFQHGLISANKELDEMEFSF